LSVTTSPNSSANFAACSASSYAAFSQYNPISGYPSLCATLAIARYIPTSEHSPSKFALKSAKISSLTPCATPTTCSAAHSLSPAISLNFSAGTPHCGHFSGGCSPSYTYPHTVQTHFFIIVFSFSLFVLRLESKESISLLK